MPNVPTAPRALRTLVVDDEPHNREHVCCLLRRAPDVAVVGEAADGVEAIRALAPDLVFLDVQMPGMTGLDVFAALGPGAMPATIFATAYDRYAVAAFDAAAVDYLVKPFDDERFARALERARSAVAARETGRLHAQLLDLLQRGTPPAGAGYAERLAVEFAGRVRSIPVRDVECITAAGTYAELHVGGRLYVMRETMQALEARLDPARFMRVHRSVIVRLDPVETLRRVVGGDGEVELRGGTRLRVSRTRREVLECWLGVTA